MGVGPSILMVNLLIANFKNMKFIPILFTLILFSCASHKEKYELHEDVSVIRDTIVVPGLHVHYPEKSRCIYFEEISYPYIDTIRINYYILKRK